MRVLAIDTATLTASVAVVDFGAAAPMVLGAADVETDRHSERLLPAVASVLETAAMTLADVDAIAVGAGPGSFTGLRIGLSTAKGLAFAIGKPMWLASSLAALAWDLAATAVDGALLVAALDARRNELYAGFYRRSGETLVAVRSECVIAPGDLEAAISSCGGGDVVEIAGDALTVHAVALTGMSANLRLRTDVRATPSAIGVAIAAAGGDRLDALFHGAPVYIRPSEAEVRYPNGVPGALPRR